MLIFCEQIFLKKASKSRSQGGYLTQKSKIGEMKCLGRGQLTYVYNRDQRRVVDIYLYM